MAYQAGANTATATTTNGRNTTQGNYRTADANKIIPDTTRQSIFLKEIIEMRTL